MFTTWDQVRDWIEDNNFPHWVFYKNRPEDRGEKANDAIVDSNNFTVSDFSDKLAMTEKYLRMYGGRCYGVGFRSPNTTVGGLVCEVRLESEQPQAVAGAMNYQSIGELREEIARSVRAEMEVQRFKDERKAFEKEKEEFESEKKSAIGALIQYFAPIGQALIKRKVMPRVAGVDTDAPVHAQPIHAIRDEQPEQEPQEVQESSVWDEFSEDEAEQVMMLIARFKKVEPNYMQLLSSVVTMAENGDATYNMAKGFLIK